MRPSEAHKKIKFQIMSILLVSAFSVMACSLWMINTQALDTEQASTQVASILEPTKQLAKKLDKELATKIEQIRQRSRRLRHKRQQRQKQPRNRQRLNKLLNNSKQHSNGMNPLIPLRCI